MKSVTHKIYYPFFSQFNDMILNQMYLGVRNNIHKKIMPFIISVRYEIHSQSLKHIKGL